MKRGGPQRDWSDARAKVEREGRCRVCGSTQRLEAAHTAGRVNDTPKPCPVCHGAGVVPVELADLFGLETLTCPFCHGYGSETPDVRWVDPDDIIPLCGPATDGSTCHGQDHGHALDLLPYLTLREQQRVVEHMEGIENARVRLCPLEYRKAVA